MSSNAQTIPRSYWIVSALALAWNLVGVAAYVAQVTMDPEALRELPEAQRVMHESMPAWAVSAFAVATSAGVLGSVFLLLRMTWAVPLFLISLAAVFVQMYHAYVLADAFMLFGVAGVVQTALIIGVGVSLIWFSRDAKEKGRFR